MGAFMSNLLAFLRRPSAIHAQVLIYLFIIRIHNLIRLSYENYLAFSEEIYTPPQLAKYDPTPDLDDDLIYAARWRAECRKSHPIRQEVELTSGRQELETTSVHDQMIARRRRRSTSRWVPIDGEEHPFRTRPLPLPPAYGRGGAWDHRGIVDDKHRDGWDWRGFPKLWPPFKLYDLAANTWMIWAIMRTLFLKQLDDLISPVTQRLFGMPGNCLLPGRLITPLAISPLLTVLLASYHLIWRIWQKIVTRDRMISVVVFLLASERDLDRFYAILEANQHGRTERAWSFGSDWTATRSWNHSSISTTEASELRPPVGQSKELRLFYEALCYQVHQGHNNQAHYFKLRLNRTSKARVKLVRRIALTTFIMVIVIGIVFLLFFGIFILTLISDYRYAHVYRGCHPPFEELRTRNQLDYYPKCFLLNWHHLLSVLVFDALENIFIWGDAGLALVFVPFFIHLLNYDLLLYWSGLEVKLERMLERVKHQYLMRNVHKRQQVAAIHNDNFTSPRPHALDGNKDRHLWDDFHDYRTHPTCLLERKQTYEEEELELELEVDIHELQCELCDFFGQIERVDKVLGDSITSCLFIWLSGCAFLNYNQLMYSADSITPVVELVLALGFLVMTLATYHLLELRRCCLKSYDVLCSLMAYDQSRYKLDFPKLLDYYMTSRTEYHIARAYAYKPTTYITILGWSFSCYFIACTLFGQRNNRPASSPSKVFGDVGWPRGENVKM